MEAIHTYRHVIDVETAKLFEGALRSILKQNPPKKLGFVGLILDYKKKEYHDIDVLIFPAKDAKIGEALLDLVKLYSRVERELKKEHERYYLVTCARKTMQELIYYLASVEEGSPGMIPVHSLFFPDYDSFKRINPQTFEKEIGKHLITLHGSFDVIKKIESIPQEKLEPYFVILDFEMHARIRSFPKHNIRASAESLFHYLRDKYGIKVKDKIPHNVEEIEKEFVKLMKTLDERTYG